MHILYSVQTRTHSGKVRENNEDAFGTVLDWKDKLGLSDEALQQRGHLFAVADGMGGHAAGEVASQLAIETLFTEYYSGEWVDPQATLTAAIAAANQAIFEKAGANARMEGMGTTLVAAIYQPEQNLVANVGDSRAYLFRSGKITQVTRDHSWVAEQVNSGILTQEDAAHHPFRNVITRSLGNETHVAPDFFQMPPQPDDVLLLCSDGLSNQVTDDEMANILRTYPLDEAADRLLALALERGAPDNVTLILIRVEEGVQRRSRSFLPWLAMVAAVMILGGFIFWTVGRKPAAPTPQSATPSLPIATYTPVVTPEMKSSAQTVVIASEETSAPDAVAAASVAAPADIAAIGVNEAVFVAPHTAASREPLYFIAGTATIVPTTEDENIDELVIHTRDDAGAERSFSATLDKAHYVDARRDGGHLILIGYDQNAQGEGVLTPLLLLAPYNSGQRFVVLWQKDDDAIDIFLQQFGLTGAIDKSANASILQLR